MLLVSVICTVFALSHSKSVTWHCHIITSSMTLHCALGPMNDMGLCILSIEQGLASFTSHRACCEVCKVLIQHTYLHLTINEMTLGNVSLVVLMQSPWIRVILAQIQFTQVRSEMIQANVCQLQQGGQKMHLGFGLGRCDSCYLYYYHFYYYFYHYCCCYYNYYYYCYCC